MNREFDPIDFPSRLLRCRATGCGWRGPEGSSKNLVVGGTCPKCHFGKVVPLYNGKAYALTIGEISVLRAMASGSGTKVAARKINLSYRTMNDYLKQIYRKMGCHSIERAILLAERAGLLRGVE